MADLKSVKLLTHHGSITSLLRARLRRKPTQTDIDYFWLKLCEERYKYDFEFFAITCITIEHKTSAELIPLKLNPAQRLLLKEFEEQRLEGTQILVQILKAKQMGFSTLTQMYMKWIQLIHKRNWNSVICAHEMTAAVNIRSMYKRSVEYMPPVGGEKFTMTPFEGTENIKLIPERGCRITVGAATRPESVRSQNVKMVHFSEEAFYPETEGNNPELIESSIISSSTKGPFTMIVRESTANGYEYFQKQWERAKKGETSYRTVFAPFYIIDIYEELFDGSYYKHNGRKKKGTVSDFIATLNEYEWNLWNCHKLCTLENLNWRRMQAATMPSETKMKQEYPADDDEAFQSSGSPAFIADHVNRLKPGCYKPEAVGTLQSLVSPQQAFVEKDKRKDVLKELRFVPDPGAYALLHGGTEAEAFKAGMNKLLIWEYPDNSVKISNRYVVSFDPQRGTSDGADYGVIKVFDRYWMMEGGTPEVVAMFYGHLNMYVTIWIAAQIAKFYNNATLVIESNTYATDKESANNDDFIFNVISDHYDNLYSRTPEEKIVEGMPREYGFPMYRGEKMMIIENYRTIISEKGYIERDEETLAEARVYEDQGNGKFGAKKGNHDDRIMCTMMGLFVCYELPMPRIIKMAPPQPVRRTAW